MFGMFKKKPLHNLTDAEIAERLDRLHDDVILNMAECPLMQTVQAKSSRGLAFETNKYRCVRIYLYSIRHVIQAAIINRNAPARILPINDSILQRTLEEMGAGCDEFSRMEAALESAMQYNEPPGWAHWFGRLAIGYIFDGNLEFMSHDDFQALEPVVLHHRG
ncbi:MAG: hypothetical protein L0219_14030 [Phycisphaerales bacterium]|nr:hypothetical protein [Phycisphaerales bacterium]